MAFYLWSPEAPYVCMCQGAYRPQLTTAGKLVKRREPAWRMAEQTRDPGCLQERCRALSKVYPVGYQHHKSSKWSGSGYPDCHFWAPLRPDGGGGNAYVELKRMGENPTGVQVATMAELLAAGNAVYLARPCCLLVGAVDEMLAKFSGVPCVYAEGSPDGPLFPFPAAAVTAAVAGVATMTAKASIPGHPADRNRQRPPIFRTPLPPGRDPLPFGPATGYTIDRPPSSGGAMLVLERWLRAAGFSPADVPYPIRVIAGEGVVHVHCRLGLARPGNDVRLWREGTPGSPFPAQVAAPLGAAVMVGTSSETLAAMMTPAVLS